MKVRYRLATGNSSTNEFSARMRGILGSVLRLFGVKSILLAKTTLNGIERYTCSSIAMLDGVPEDLSDAADAYRDTLAGIAAIGGVVSAEIELTDREMERYAAVWRGSGGDMPYGSLPALDDQDLGIRLVNAAEEDAYKAARDGSHADVPEFSASAAESMDRVDGSSGSGRVVLVYEAVANMLPVEGRDYRLNPVEKQGGVVGFKPVAYTKIGKIWLEYLRENLGKYLASSGGPDSVPSDEADGQDDSQHEQQQQNRQEAGDGEHNENEENNDQ